MDAETEEIFARLKVVAVGRLVVLVSHRAWTLRGVDSVVVLDGGCGGARNLPGANDRPYITLQKALRPNWRGK